MPGRHGGYHNARGGGGRGRGHVGRGRGHNQGRGGYEDGRGGAGRHGRGGAGRGGRGGGGGRGRGPDLSNVQSLLSNIILSSVTPNFSFYMYSIDCRNSQGEAIDSLTRRGALFNQAIWGTLLGGKDDQTPVLSKKEKADLERIVFFSGSFFYSARPIPKLEVKHLPLEILNGTTSDGDTFTVQRVFHYKAPSELTTPVVSGSNKNEIVCDHRCADCVKAFPDVRGLLQHCQETGHSPVFDDTNAGAVRTAEAKPAVFLSYVNMVLSRALGERLAKWGREYVNPARFSTPTDRQGRELGVLIYEAFSCEFGLVKPKTTQPAKAHLGLTIDLRAKVLRSESLLDQLYRGESPNNNYTFTKQDIQRAKRFWIGTQIIYKADKKCYSVVDLHFDHSAATLPLEINGKKISHAEYFAKRKNIKLQYPNACPMIECLGRRKQPIFLPAELVCGDELDRRVKEMLPSVASFTPEKRNEAIEEIKAFLIPGAQKTKNAGGLLPACGIVLKEDRLQAKATVMPVPALITAGISVPQRYAENWAPVIAKSRFQVDSSRAVKLSPVVFYSKNLRQGSRDVYNTIRNLVNGFQASYMFGDAVDFVEAGENEQHWGSVERYFGGQVKENIFVLDFTKPRGSTLDGAYPIVKQILTKAGHLSQFVNFNTYAHDQPRDQRKSTTILQGVARQILQKCSVRLWWVEIPKSIPLPAVFVGVDVFHAPRVYDPIKKQRVAKASCAAIIVEVIRPDSHKKHKVEIYSETYARSAGEEYGLREALKTAITNALKILKVNPMCCIVWRDGIGEGAFETLAGEEIKGIRAGLNGEKLIGTEAAQPESNGVPLTYMVAQKRIAVKFTTRALPGIPDGKFGAPPGTLVEGIQGLKYDTFYIQGRAPPQSTPKPVRFIVVERDAQLKSVNLPELTWAMCHNYSNWPGSIKLPSQCQYAHLLAELAGMMPTCGASIDHKQLANTVHFL